MARLRRHLSTVAAIVVAGAAAAQDRAITYNLFGSPGLLEMPTALSADDGEIGGTLSYFGDQLRTSFTLQVTPRLSATFRYSGVRGFSDPTEEDEDGTLWDRSFDLRYRFTDEGNWTPAVAVGLRDLLGTGYYAGEYVVATKTVGSSVRVTAGLGWGRYATDGGFENPLGAISDNFLTRPPEFVSGEEQGGDLNLSSLFRGDAAVFGGVEWAPSPRWILKAEYSSDAGYVRADGSPLFERASPYNFGVVWRPRPGMQVGLGYLYGTTLSFGATVTINPNERPFGTGLDAAPVPVAVRGLAAELDRPALPAAALRERLAAELRAEGITLLALELDGARARLRYSNARYRTEAQAMGRIARILTVEMPPSVETFVLEPVAAGIPLSSMTFARGDLEAFENEVGGTDAAWSRAVLADSGPEAGLVALPPRRDAFTWNLRPVVGYSFFNPDRPVSLSLSAELSAEWRFAPNLVLSGAIRQQILPRTDGEGADPEPVEPLGGVPVVRRDGGLYGGDGLPTLDRLTLAWYGRPAENLYSRVTVGYLESMYGGVSTELLWKPATSRLGLGLELNYARKRGYDRQFDFQDYDVVTGHASAYWDPGNGFHYRVDAGRYLAGDWGATFAVDREFRNGWVVGGYFTLTDIPFEDYGEGSFDKGLRVEVPMDFILGRPTPRVRSVTLQSLTRDGGARLSVPGRLYDTVRDAHVADLEDSWGRFWR